MGQLCDNNLVAQANHLIEEEIVLDGEHFPAHRVVSSEPDICLLCNRSIEEPSTVFPKEFWVVGGVTMVLAELVRDSVLVKEVPDVDAHPHVCKPGPVFRVRINLLFSIAVGVVDQMLQLVGCRDGKRSLDKELT
jgi:hypothetical protein